MPSPQNRTPRPRTSSRPRRKPKASDYPVSISFLGAAGNVTGSRFLVQADGARVLVDCGMYQERAYASRNWDPFPVSPDTIDAVVLTHAHLDHSGYIPRLVREGFRGRIYCTQATADIAEVILEDSARIQEEDAAYKKKRHEREGRKGPHPEVPLYTTEDVARAMTHFSPIPYHRKTYVSDSLVFELRDAGHILGSATVRMEAGQKGQKRVIVFSGDMGRAHRPVLLDPERYDRADYVVIESTYGDRLHNHGADIEQQLADVINATVKRGGNVVIPSFAVERAQEVLYHLKRLMDSKRIPRMLTFLDSPMAQDVTRLFSSHTDLLDANLAAAFRSGNSPFNFPGLHMVRSVDESKAINSIRGGAIVIAGAGMCNGGRIKHHLVNNISRPDSTVLFVGYQAVGTLGREIVNGRDPVRILGESHDVRAKIESIQGFSAHADRDELMGWLTSLEAPPRGVFLVHGEDEALHAFEQHIEQRTGWKVTIPSYGDIIPLE
jgi:metallo-beta-lactamase family protein